MTVELILGNCLDILPTLEAGSVDAVITDPPYDKALLRFSKGFPQKVQTIVAISVCWCFQRPWCCWQQK